MQYDIVLVSSCFHSFLKQSSIATGRKGPDRPPSPPRNICVVFIWVCFWSFRADSPPTPSPYVASIILCTDSRVVVRTDNRSVVHKENRSVVRTDNRSDVCTETELLSAQAADPLSAQTTEPLFAQTPDLLSAQTTDL